MSAREWTLTVRAPAPMRTTNAARRLHWGKTSGERRMLRDVVCAEARAARLPTGLDRVHVAICCRFPDRLRRDASNLHDQVGKACVDALGPARTVRDAKSPTGWRREPGHGLVADDDQGHVDGPYISIGEPLAPVERRRYPFGGLTITITDLSEPTDRAAAGGGAGNPAGEHQPPPAPTGCGRPGCRESEGGYVFVASTEPCPQCNEAPEG